MSTTNLDEQKFARQQIFDSFINRFIINRKPSSVNLGNCAYKPKSGNLNEGCAIAPYILRYKPEMEGQSVSALFNQYRSDLSPTLITAGKDFAGHFQRLHDRPASLLLSRNFRLGEHEATPQEVVLRIYAAQDLAGRFDLFFPRHRIEDILARCLLTLTEEGSEISS